MIRPQTWTANNLWFPIIVVNIILQKEKWLLLAIFRVKILKYCHAKLNWQIAQINVALLALTTSGKHPY